MSSHYTRKGLLQSLKDVGVELGDTVFVHASLGRLGLCEGCRTMADHCSMAFETLRQAVGPDGTILVPTYTYSIGKGELFDVDESPSTIGDFTEFFRQLPDSVRSADPMLSVAGQGPQAQKLLTRLPRTCYGKDSVYDRLYHIKAKILTIGLGLYWATYRHYIEEHCRVPFRFIKLFTGEIRESGIARKETWEYFAAPLLANCQPDGVPLERMIREQKLCLTSSIGRAEVCSVRADTYRDFAEKKLQENPWLTAVGPALSTTELISLEDERVGCRSYHVALEAGDDAYEIVKKIAPLPRDIVSDGFDACLHAIGQILPLRVHSYPTGTRCFTWVVPEKWTCHGAYIETLGGSRLVDYQNSPLHVVSYSYPVDKTVSRDELVDHLHFHPTLDDAIPFAYSYLDRVWGFCCPKNILSMLTDKTYRVCIDSSRTYGSLKVGEITAPGKTDHCFILCAHLDHPGQANDGLSGVAVGVEVLRRVLAAEDWKHTIKLLIVSETFGSVAWLSHNQHLSGSMRAGIFLDMLGLENPHVLQSAQNSDTIWEKLAAKSVLASDSGAWAGPHHKAVTNEEGPFNAPGVRVPMMWLSRVKEPSGAGDGWPFPEFHSNLDSISLVSKHSLQKSADLVTHILRVWDQQVVPKPLY